MNNEDITISDEIYNTQNISNFVENVEKSSKNQFLSESLMNKQNIDFITQENANKSEKPLEEMDIDYCKDIPREDNSHNINISNNEMRLSTDVKPVPLEIFNCKSSIGNEFLSYQEFLNYLNDIRSVNNFDNIFNYFNKCNNEIASNQSKLCGIINLQKSNTYSTLNMKNSVNQNDLLYNYHPCKKFHNENSFVNEFFDENDYKKLKELEKILQIQK